MKVSIRKHNKSGLYHVYCDEYKSTEPMKKHVAEYHKQRIEQGGKIHKRLRFNHEYSEDHDPGAIAEREYRIVYNAYRNMIGLSQEELDNLADIHNHFHRSQAEQLFGAISYLQELEGNPDPILNDFSNKLRDILEIDSRSGVIMLDVFDQYIETLTGHSIY